MGAQNRKERVEGGLDDADDTIKNLGVKAKHLPPCET